MALFYFVLLIVNGCLLHRSFVNGGDPVVFFPPFELRAVSGDDSPYMVPVTNQFQVTDNIQNQRQPKQLLHTRQDLPPSPPPQVDHNQQVNEIPSMPTAEESHHHDNSSHLSMHDVLVALGVDEKGHVTKDNLRAAARDYDYPPGYPNYSSYPHSPSYDYPPRPSYSPTYPPSYGSYAPPAYHEPSYAMVPPIAAHHITSPKVKPLLDKLDLVKPVATKVASKFSGLIGFVLALLTGSSFGGSELSGFKDIVINGIIKPLMIAKGGIKSLISKLAIPLLSLLLINVEFLITAWWLWEDCPAPEPVHVAYPYPKPSYNPYR